jgi:hypothetical protein
MSELRTQLEQMRDAYRATRYGGDLAAEVVGAPPATMRRSRILRIVTAGSAISAIAAGVALWLTLRPASSPPPTEQIAVVEVETTVPTMADLSTMPEFPEDVSLVPSAESLEMPSMPQMPSFDFSFSSSEEQTKESA